MNTISKALWVTDIHLKYSTLDVTRKLFKLLLKELKNNDVDSLIISGDTNDTKSIIRSECLDQLRNFLKQVKVPSYVLVGNHDMVNTSHPELGHCLDSLNDIEDVFVIDKPTIIGNIKFIPYIHNPNDLRKELKKDEVDYLVAHNGINGAEMNSKGTFDSFSLSSGSFSDFKRVFVGHYHCYNEIDNIVYLGSPFTHSFAEANIDKYIGIIDFDNNELDLIETNLRKHIDYTINTDKKSNVDIKARPEDLVRITLEGKKDNNNKMLEKYKDIQAKFVLKNIETNKKKRLNVDLNKDKSLILKEYLEYLKKDVDLEIDKLLKLGEKYIA